MVHVVTEYVPVLFCNPELSLPRARLSPGQTARRRAHPRCLQLPSRVHLSRHLPVRPHNSLEAGHPMPIPRGLVDQSQVPAKRSLRPLRGHSVQPIDRAAAQREALRPDLAAGPDSAQARCLPGIAADLRAGECQFKFLTSPCEPIRATEDPRFEYVLHRLAILVMDSCQMLSSKTLSTKIFALLRTPLHVKSIVAQTS